jgi:hypothetical protein
MPSSVARLVGQDHQRLVRLLKRACSAGPNQTRWREEFVNLLVAHRVAERDHVLRHIADEVAETRAAAAEQDQRDLVLESLAEQVQQAAIGTDDFGHLCRRAVTTVTTHDEALREVLADLDKVVGRKEMRRLGGVYERSRDRHLEGERPHRPPPRRLDVSRAELYELARKAGIEGRSGMSRDQLIDELQRRQNH